MVDFKLSLGAVALAVSSRSRRTPERTSAASARLLSSFSPRWMQRTHVAALLREMVEFKPTLGAVALAAVLAFPSHPGANRYHKRGGGRARQRHWIRGYNTLITRLYPPLVISYRG